MPLARRSAIGTTPTRREYQRIEARAPWTLLFALLPAGTLVNGLVAAEVDEVL
jgi:hypothetical protein